MLRCLLPLLLAVLALMGRDAGAQPYPSKPIRVVVPFAAGGAVDALARIIGAKFQDNVGQPVVIENRAGAGGTTGANDVAKSQPDGYTILQNTNGQAISPAIYRTLPFDTLRDFIPVTQLVATSTVLVANPKLPVRNLKELIVLAKANPGKLNYGMTGVGNSLHLTMEMLKRAAGIDIQAIPYRGDALINTALIAGEVDVAIVPIGTIVPLIKGGQLRALAVNSAKRSPRIARRADRGRGRHPRLRGVGLAGLVRAGQDAARHRCRDLCARPRRSSATPRCSGGCGPWATSRWARRPTSSAPYSGKTSRNLLRSSKEAGIPRQ